MPSDSQFAIAMRHQQEAERAEQQRIKNLVLNYDLQDSSAESGTGSTNLLNDPFSHPNPNLRGPLPTRSPLCLVPHNIDKIKHAHTTLSEGLNAGDKHQHNASLHQSSPHHTTAARPVDKSSSNRSGHRARKLQLSDVDWYDGIQKTRPRSPTSGTSPDPGPRLIAAGRPSRGSFRGSRGTLR